MLILPDLQNTSVQRQRRVLLNCEYPTCVLFCALHFLTGRQGVVVEMIFMALFVILVHLFVDAAHSSFYLKAQ